MTSRHRVVFRHREKAAIIKLRLHHWPIQNIAQLLRRSTSVVHKVLTREYQLHWQLRKLRIYDLRKLPNQMKARIAGSERLWMVRYGSKWLKWMESDKTEPP